MTDKDRTRVLKANPADQSAWRSWTEALYPKVMFTLFGYSNGQTSDATDATQEAFERFIRYKALNRVSDDRTALAYLVTSARNYLVDEMKKRANTVELDDRRHAETADQRARLVAELSDLIAVLDKDDQEVVNLALEGHSIENIATKLEISYSAAAQRLSRARRSMKEIAKPQSRFRAKSGL